jgi:hypothetical protein
VVESRTGKLSFRAHAQMPVIAESSDEVPSSQLSYMDTFSTLCKRVEKKIHFSSIEDEAGNVLRQEMQSSIVSSQTVTSYC